MRVQCYLGNSLWVGKATILWSFRACSYNSFSEWEWSCSDLPANTESEAVWKSSSLHLKTNTKRQTLTVITTALHHLTWCLMCSKHDNTLAGLICWFADILNITADKCDQFHLCWSPFHLGFLKVLIVSKYISYSRWIKTSSASWAALQYVHYIPLRWFFRTLPWRRQEQKQANEGQSPNGWFVHLPDTDMRTLLMV